MTTTTVESLAPPRRTLQVSWQRIASDVLLLSGISLLIVAAIALRVALVAQPIVEPQLALGASAVFGMLGVLVVASARYVRELA